MTVKILELARDDLIAGFEFYEKRELGLGRYFLTSLYSDIDSLETSGGNHATPHRHFHRLLSKKFPFAIYYSMESEAVRVRAVVDCRRSPTWIKKHLKEA